MKAITDAIATLRQQRAKIEDKIDALKREAYILDQSIEAVERASNLQRISSKRIRLNCQRCKEPFDAKREGTLYCQRPECVEARKKAARKGVVLVKGDAIKT